MTRNCCRKKLVHARHFLTSYIHQLLIFFVYFITGINYFKCNTAPKKGKKEMIFGAEAILFFFPPQNAPPPPHRIISLRATYFLAPYFHAIKYQTQKWLFLSTFTKKGPQTYNNNNKKRSTKKRGKTPTIAQHKLHRLKSFKRANHYNRRNTYTYYIFF